MPLPQPLVVDAATPVVRPVPDPQILWPTFPGYGTNGGSDSGTFPSLVAIKARRAARPPGFLDAFVEAVWAAQDRILILDDFLFKTLDGQSQQVRYDQILDWLPDGLVANDIRFLTNSHEDKVEQQQIQAQFATRIAAINRSASHRAGMATIEIRFSLGSKFPYVHDRFAIVDNELWHFGATVGGLHHLVNAATRGWDAMAHQALRFFNDAWNGDDDIYPGGRHG
ncbi:hypothetical protein [Burkholderia multivorans]|uniref:hypothetical protein n=1 Tax=Burkholderia multivorans TaxID=87883 RepID=UPI001C24B67D|nr:hypothetical protein [Burkholderia multivorans]MBU9454720.1 hypothetical protein [Burkholderia multivorans]